MRCIIFFAVLATVAWAGDPWPTRVPDKLALCYTNRAIGNRYKRMPQSVDNLIALIRKIEAHADTQLWTAGKMASTLIKRFRYDGIVDLANAQPDVVPVTVERRESDKFKLQWRLVPGSAAEFPESVLSLEEQCAMHWMLSYTVNHTMRSENRAPLPAGRARGLTYDDDDDAAGNAESHDGHHDGAHDTDDAADVEPASDDAGVPLVDEEDAVNEPSNAEEKLEENAEAEDKEATPNEDDNFADPPEGNEEGSMNAGETDAGETDAGETDATDDFQPVGSTDEEDSDNAWGSNTDEEESFWRRKRQASTTADIPRDPKPLEIGVVHTKYGVVAMGPVLMGIAAGSEPQTAKLGDIIKDPNFEISPSSLERVVDNVWVATLAADIGQTALLRAPQRYEAFGPRGSWNNSYCPREYKLDVTENDHSYLSNAEFYGGLDGLLMALRLKSWDTSSYLKLSAILEMYYSENGIHGDHTYRACNRLNNYNEHVDTAVLKEQSLNAALVMYAKGLDGAPSLSPDVKPVDKIGVYVNSTMSEINTYLGNMNNVAADFTQCKGAPSFASETPATYTDLTFVVDQFSDHASIEKQKELAAALALTLDVQLGGSRLELVSGKDGAVFVTFEASNNRASLACNITTQQIAYSERRIADTLSKTRTRILAERSNEKTNKVSGTNTRAILFFVNTYSSQSAEKDEIKKNLAKMLTEMPDVHIMFATFASPEEFRPFVADFDRDIIRMQTYTNYADAAPVIAGRLATVGARLTYPNCKDTSKTANTTETQYIFNGYLNTHTVQYFRLGAEHFYSSNVLVLRLKSEYGVARYCISNKKTTPGPGDTCKNALKAGETVEFKVTQPCGKQVPPYCPSYYISAAPLNVDDDIPCSDQNCHTPDQVKITFTHDGMRCSGSADTIVNLLLVVAAVFISMLLRG